MKVTRCEVVREGRLSKIIVNEEVFKITGNDLSITLLDYIEKNGSIELSNERFMSYADLLILLDFGLKRDLLADEDRSCHLVYGMIKDLPPSCIRINNVRSLGRKIRMIYMLPTSKEFPVNLNIDKNIVRPKRISDLIDVKNSLY